MSHREKILAAAVLVLIVAFGSRWLYGRYERGMESRQAQLNVAQEELTLVKHALNQGERAVRQLEGWRERSLPANRDKALSLYKAWLLDKAKQAGLTVDDIKPAGRPTPSTAFQAIGYQIEATGTLSSVAAMLYEFYKSPQLHQITRLRLTRPPGAAQLQVSMETEALILPGANATDSLPAGESKRLKLASLAEYQKTLGERDLTNVYTPPQPPGEKRDVPVPPKFDDAEQAHFTGTVGPNDALEAWINVRTTGETLHVSAGDPVKVGNLEGQIVSIDLRSLVFETDGKKYRVALGQSLRKGTELGADGKAASDAKPEEPKS
jgi:hypothetical protein